MAEILLMSAALAAGVAGGYAILWFRSRRADAPASELDLATLHPDLVAHCEAHGRAMQGSPLITPPGVRHEP